MMNDQLMTKLECQRHARQPSRLTRFRHLDFIRHSCLVIILHPAVINISQLERRNRAVIFDFLLYESERKQSYEGRTAASAA